jgi:hypothetical protein
VIFCYVFLDYFEMDIVSPGITRTAQTYFNLTHRTFLGKYSERREQKQQTGLIDFTEPKTTGAMIIQNGRRNPGSRFFIIG